MLFAIGKTGTLTEDQAVVERFVNASGKTDNRVLLHAYLASYYQASFNNPIDQALILRGKELAQTGATDFSQVDTHWTKVGEIPFDFNRRRMSVVLKESCGATRIITKGAVKEILAVYSQVLTDEKEQQLNEHWHEELLHTAVRMQSKGLRVIAVAQSNKVLSAQNVSEKDESNLTFVGFVTFFDPPKASAIEAVKRLVEAGVSIRVLTGDTKEVAMAVCHKIGIQVNNALTGSDVEKLSDAELAQCVENTHLFARLSPLQKERVVLSLREQGYVVGFMGDGINDVAALHAADAGVSVDSAVDVAKEAASIILTRKDLVVLERAVYEGRRTYGNTIKYVKATASSNFGNMLSVLVASAFLPFCQ